MASVRETFDRMPQLFRKDGAQGLTAVYQFDITGDDGGRWYAAVREGELTVGEGTHASPNVTITMAAGHFVDMVEGRLGGMRAFITGKLKVKGDMMLAGRMQKFLNVKLV
ncbi:MAG: SCP2 sterol-binding domain-containing protein [Deltaproteobacteria bacterium]|nr:SCP2 sterol-binding domain-containing protein [Deltaproteobacteria bacterium]